MTDHIEARLLRLAEKATMDYPAFARGRDELLRPSTVSQLARVMGAARAFIAFGRKNSGPYYIPHNPMCADSRHEHTGSRYDAKGTYLGGWRADHECPPCDCGAKALIDLIAALDADAPEGGAGK